MAKSAEAEAWERRCQALVDRIVVKYESVKREHAHGNHTREDSYRQAMLSMIGELNALTANPPRGAKLPKLPRVR